MTAKRHERVTEVFHGAAERPAPERPAFLAAECGSDAGLREEVESLLAHDRPGSSALDSPILGTGFNVTEVVETDAAAAAELPVQIGPYRILGVLGTGSMGVVYRAQQVTPARVVALKVMRPGRVSRSLQRRFQDEIRSLARLQHPGIAQIYDAGEEQRGHVARPYMAMELVDGRPLSDYARERQLDPRARLELLARICDAVQHAHLQGVIHRDLKPANILVEDGDDGPRPRILDFGVARLTDRDIQAATLATEQGQLVGTLAYMSPEQVAGNPDELDTRCDVYALGVIGYELLCGQLPIDVREMPVYPALQAIREQIPPLLAARDRQFRGDLSTIMGKALEKEKSQRYESASALATDIRLFLAHRPILAQPPSAFYVLRKFVRRNRVLTGALLLVVGSLLVGGFAATYGLIRADVANRELRARYGEMRDTVSFLVGDFTTNLDRIGGTTELRRDLLGRQQTLIQSLLAKNPRDAELLRVQANFLENLSNMELAEGRIEETRELRERTLVIRRRIVALEPANPECYADLSISLVKLGDVFQNQNALQAAEPWWREALEIDERLARDHPDSRRFLDNLAHSFARLGMLARTTYRPAECERLYQQCVDTYTRLLELEPGRLLTLYGLWEIESNLSSLAKEQGALPDAEIRAQNALRYTSQLVAAAPDNRVYLAAHADAEYAVAGRLRASGNIPGALQHLAEAQRILEKLQSLDPQDLVCRRSLCRVLLSHSDIVFAEGRVSAAYVLANQTLDVARWLSNNDPADDGAAARLTAARLTAAALHGVARAALALGLHEEAHCNAREERELRQKLAERDAATAEDARAYARCLLWPPETADPQRAREAAQRAVDLSGGASPSCWRSLGACYRVLLDNVRAKECFERGLALISNDAAALRASLCSDLDEVEVDLAGD